MYQVTFINVNKKISKSVKQLKSKNSHSLRVADQLLKEVQKVTANKINMEIVVTDIAAEKEYTFVNVFVDPEGSSPNLIEMLEDEILEDTESSEPFKQKLLMGLEQQYQDEELPDFNTPDKNKKNSLFSKKTNKEKNKSQPFNKTFDVPEKKGIKLFTKKNKDKINKSDFEDLNEVLEPEISSAENILSDFTEVSMTEVNSDEVEENVLEHDVIINSDFNEISETNTSNEEYNYEEPFSEEVIHEPEETFSDNEPEELYEKEKSNVVVFPAYDKYLDMELVEKAIVRQNERLQKEHLVKFLGLNALSTDQAQTELDALKINYALNSLDEAKFMIIRDYFNSSVGDIKDKTQNGLAQIYDQVMTFDFQEEAKKDLTEEFDNFLKVKESLLESYKQEQTNEFEQKKEKFELEQRKELENFIRQQEIELNQHVQELDNKGSSRIAVYKDNMQTEINNNRESLLEEKVVELKYNSINSMTEAKRKSIRNFETELDNAVDDTWSKTQVALAELKQDISNLIPEWKVEIEEKRKMAAEEREEARREEKLVLEKQRIRLQSEQLEYSKNNKVENESEKIAELVEARLKKYDKKISSTLEYSDNKFKSEPITQQVVSTSKESQSSFKKYLAISAVILLSISTGLLASSAFSSENSNDQPVPVVEASTNDGIAESLLLLEEKISNLEQQSTTEETVSLDDLLNEKNYEKAISLYKDQDSLEKIEETLYVSKDLAFLITFNKTTDTAFGDLDEAILSGDSKKVSDIFKSLKDDVKEQLSKSRKTDIALALYQTDQNELANTLIGMNEIKN